MTQATKIGEILLVEDDARDAELTLRALRPNRLAQRVRWLKDGAEALDYLLGEARANTAAPRPQLVMLDIRMPRVDGLDVLRRLKADVWARTIPVVMMTSSDEESDVAESYRLGANSYIVKPIDIDAFHEAVGRVGLYWGSTNRVPQ
jgi:two-component system response regulator